MYRLSLDEIHTTVATSNVLDSADDSKDMNVTIGCYVATVYDEQWYVGIEMVTECSVEHRDVTIRFISRNRFNRYISV